MTTKQPEGPTKMSTSTTALSGSISDPKFSGMGKFDVFEIIEKDDPTMVRDERTLTSESAELPEAFFEYFVVQKAS
jgi:hypothetical protein|tara:strand:+ start:63 stop:290 length:228 start_codon:yes stop_codon:yes gene_type:complete